jgi:secretion/DNA translocation related TadE-like protein
MTRGSGKLASDERGSGGILALIVLALIAVLALAVVGVGVALAARQRVVSAADAGALAAADTALGIHPGVPCQRAAEVVAAHGATLTACSLEGVVATVEASASFAGIPIEVSARAGPPR